MNNKLKTKIDNDLLNAYKNGPKSLFEIYKYVFSAKGKRIRPILTLLTSKSLYGEYNKSYQAAIAIEILHNFTLIHDDIMDNDSIRHGQKTIHEKWDIPNAILSGDLILALSLKTLTDSNYKTEIINTFTNGLVAVCEGQALDKEFENKKIVSEKEYLAMVEKKTSYLIAMAIKIGSQCYDASEEIQNKLFKFGILIGKAFQIQDDLLEITSNPKTMKKSLDSDIVLGKKTYPMIIAQQYNQQTINELLNNTNIDIELKLKSFKEFFFENKIDSEIKNKINELYQESINCLSDIKFKSNELIEFTKLLMERNM